MREAVGGSMLFYIILIFIFIYIVFIGLIMNYAATYRASNYVITYLEETEGRASTDLSSTSELCQDLRRRKYSNRIYLSCRENSNGDAIYKVKTLVAFELPLMGIGFNLEVNNETKSIYGEKCYIETTTNPDDEVLIEACRW